MWTKCDIFEHFNVINDENILNSPQIEANRIFIKKTDISIEIINKWWNAVQNYPEFFTDSPSKILNKTNFAENRHDQSIWSVLCKLNNVNVISNDKSPILVYRIKE